MRLSAPRPLPLLAQGAALEGIAGETRPDTRAGREPVLGTEAAGPAEFVAVEEAAAVIS
jgi:hypothetical protein